MAEYRHSAHATFDLKYHVTWVAKYRYKMLRGRIDQIPASPFVLMRDVTRTLASGVQALLPAHFLAIRGRLVTFIREQLGKPIPAGGIGARE